MNQLTFSLEEPRAKDFRAPGFGKDWETTVLTWHSDIFSLLHAYGPDGWSSRTCVEPCQPTRDGTLQASSGRFLNSGMGTAGAHWTLNLQEFPAFQEQSPSDEGVSSLLDILETGDHLLRFSLSPKACAGILRRKENSRTELPWRLKKNLENVRGQRKSPRP